MKSLKNRTIGFYIQAAIPLLCLVSLVAYLVYASALGKYDVKVILGLGIGCALSTVQFWVKTGIIELIASIIISVTLFYFVTLTETVGSYADYLNNIVAFGHSELIGQMNMTVIITAITAILGIVGCFVSGQKKQKNE